MDFLSIPLQLLNNMDMVWSFMLLMIRYGTMFLLVPGMSAGLGRDIEYRLPVIFVLSCVSIGTGPYATVPGNWGVFVEQAVGESLFGMAVGVIPLMVVSGLQTAGYLTSTTMGLGAGQLIDPSIGIQVASISRILGDLVILLMFATGAHYVLIQAVAGMGGTIVPGSFTISEATLNLLIDRSGDIFRVAVMASAPVIVALLLTQFVMGLITKAVPTVNIFIMSFPLTIGIGLIITSLSLPDTMRFIDREIAGIENSVAIVVEDTTRK